MRGRGICALALCAGAFVWLLALCAPAALADTLEQLREQAARPLEATIEAYGRTIELNLSADVPDADSMGVYLAKYESGEVREGTPAQEELPQKRRGIALRARPKEVFSLQTLPEDYHAFGHPLTGFEAIDSVWALLEPRISLVDGVTAEVTDLQAYSPHYYYDKVKGEWGDLAVAGSVGTYQIDYDVSLYGAPVFRRNPFYRDQQAYLDEGAVEDSVMFVSLNAAVEVTQEGEPCAAGWYGLPRVTGALAQNVDLAPLESIYDVLTTLAEEGHLRQAYWLRLGYEGFEYGERPREWKPTEERDFLFKPTFRLLLKIIAL